MRRSVTGYQDIADRLRERIEAGQYLPGKRIPTEADLQHEFGTARETVRKGIRILKDEGLVEVRLGHGTFVREAEPDFVQLGPGDEAVVLGGTLQVNRADGSIEHYSAGTKVSPQATGK
jgi:DNA-binding FadR family transcriptional regulator